MLPFLEGERAINRGLNIVGPMKILEEKQRPDQLRKVLSTL